MKKLLIALALFSLFHGSESQARIGGGRSFGSRGSRMATPRSAPLYRNYGNTSPGMQHQPSTPMGFGGGGFMRSLAGGLAGGFIGSMLFRSMGWAGEPGMGMGGGRGFGFLEILLFAGVIFLVFKWIKGRGGLSHLAPASGGMARSQSLPFNVGAQTTGPLDLSVVGSDLEGFKEARVDDFFKMQAALMNRDLGGVRERMTAEIFTILESDVAQLKNAGKINRIENIAVRETELVEAWRENGLDYATLRLKASLLDYTVDDKTGAVLAGSPSDPTKFDEYWTFVSDRPHSWKLSAIEN